MSPPDAEQPSGAIPRASDDPSPGAAERVILLLRWAVVLVVLLGAAIVLVEVAMGRRFTDQAVHEFVASFGIWAPIIFILLFTTIGSLLVPTTVLTVVGATLFGAWAGFFYSLVGAFIAAMLGFMAARTVARRRVVRWLDRRAGRVAEWERRLERHGFMTAMFMRLLYLPNGLINVVCGVSRIRAPIYAVATFFGLLPMVFAIAFITGGAKKALLGGDWSALGKPEVLWSIALFLVCIAVPFVSGAVRRRVKTKRLLRSPFSEISDMFDPVESDESDPET